MTSLQSHVGCREVLLTHLAAFMINISLLFHLIFGQRVTFWMLYERLLFDGNDRFEKKSQYFSIPNTTVTFRSANEREAGFYYNYLLYFIT